jgi:hypothetical protein
MRRITPGWSQKGKTIGKPPPTPRGPPQGRAYSCLRTRRNEAFLLRHWGGHVTKECPTISVAQSTVASQRTAVSDRLVLMWYPPGLPPPSSYRDLLHQCGLTIQCMLSRC